MSSSSIVAGNAKPGVGWADVALAGLLIAVFLFFSARDISPAPYGSDEADYMYVTSLGFLANYTDTPSRSVLEMVRSARHFGLSEGRRVDVSEFARSSDDVNFYRHWHGPLYFYWLVLASSWLHSAQSVRGASLVFPVLTFLVVYGGCLWLLPRRQARVSGCLAGALFLWSYPIVGSADVGPHTIFALCYLLSLVLAAKAFASERRVYWYGAVAAAGLAYCTVGVAFVLVFTLMVLGVLEQRSLAVDWRLARNSAMVFAATVLVAWPGAILKLSSLKTYMIMAYHSLFRHGSWGQVTFGETWSIRFHDSPAEWLLLAVAVALYLVRRDLPNRRLYLPFLAFGSFMLLTTLRMNTDVPRYLIPFLPALNVFTGLTFGGWLTGRAAWIRGAATVGLCAVLFANTGRALLMHPPQPDPRPAAMLASIAAEGLHTKSVLVPQTDIPVIHYYFPHSRLRGYLEEGAIPAEFSRGAFDAVLYPGYPVRIVLTARQAAPSSAPTGVPATREGK